MITSNRAFDDEEMAEIVFAAIAHYLDRRSLLEERISSTLECVRAKRGLKSEELRGCTHEIESLEQEIRDLTIYARQWKHYAILEPEFARSLKELQLLKEAFEGIASFATS